MVLLAGFTSARANSLSHVVCREDVSAEERAQLEGKLRQITGFRDLSFDSQGALHFSPNTVLGGSVTARALLERAIYGSRIIIIEDASRRADVVFARVTPGKWRHLSQSPSQVFVVLIDFADFDHLIGDEPALLSFDVGWALLHELDHAVTDSEDSTSPGQPGECEAHLNQMRQECGLPLRVEYFHTLFPIAANSDFRTQFVRLSFVQKSGPATPKKHYWLVWDARLVGDLDERRVATLR